MSSHKDSAGRGMLAGFIREIENMETTLECEETISKLGRKCFQNTINWMKDRANSYASMNPKLKGGGVPYPERCAEGVAPLEEGVQEVSGRCTEGAQEVLHKGKDSKVKERIGQERLEKPPIPPGNQLSPGDRFAASMDGAHLPILNAWRMAWKEAKGKEPVLTGKDYQEATALSTEGLLLPDLLPAFQAYLADEFMGKNGHSFKGFCNNPSKWINLTSEPADTGPTQEELAEQWRLATERDRREAMGQ